MAIHDQRASRLAGALLTLALAPAVRAELPNHAAVHQSPTPSWVEVVDLGPLLKRGLMKAEQDRVVLHDTQILVPAKGPAQHYEHVLYHFDNGTDVEDLSTISLDFDPSYQELLVHAVRAWRQGEWSDRIEPSRSSVVQVEEFLERKIYDQVQSLVLIVDDLRVGDLLSVEYTLVGSNPVLGDDWAESVWLAAEAVSRRSVRVLAERPVDYALHGGARAPARDAHAGGRREITWSFEALPDPKFWSAVPWAYSPRPWIQLSTFSSWAEVAAWAQPLFAVPPPSAEIEEIASGLTGRGKERLLVEARDWVQRSIRYFAVPIGPHSHRPHTPVETLNRRYGDCKDKALVLLALLKHLEIEAWPVLVNTDWREGVASFLPSPFAFDHVIVAARVGDHEAWLDPTLTHQGGKGLDDLRVPGYRLGLEIEPQRSSALSEMPEAQRTGSVTEAFHHYKVAEDLKKYEVDIKTVMRGEEAESMRRHLDGVSKKELQQRYLDYYETDELTVTVRKPLEIQDDRESNLLEVFEQYAVSSDGADLEWPFRTLDLELGSELPQAEDERDVPLALPFPQRRREMIRIDVPSEWGFVPVNEEVINDWLRFAVRSTIDRGGRSITLEYSLETIAETVAVADFADYSRDLEKLNSHLGYSLGDPEALGVPSMFSSEVPAVLWSSALGALGALGVLAFLVLSRVSGKRLVGFWVPSGRPQPELAERLGDQAVYYRDPSRPILMASAFVILASCSSALMVPAGLLPDSLPQELFVLELFLYLSYIAFLCIAAILVIRAQRRLLRNLEAFGLIRLNPSLAWSTWSWIVPIAFLFVPYRSFRQIGIGSSLPRDRRVVLRLIGCWWGLWIFSTVAGSWVERVGSKVGPGPLVATQTVAMLSFIAQFLCGLLLVTLLLVLRSSQREAARLAVQADAASRGLASSPEELAERLDSGHQAVAGHQEVAGHQGVATT